MRYFCKNSGTD